MMANDSFNWNSPEDYFRLFDEGPLTNSNIKNSTTPLPSATSTSPPPPPPVPSSLPSFSSTQSTPTTPGFGLVGSTSRGGGGSFGGDDSIIGVNSNNGFGSGDNFLDTDDTTGLYYQLNSNANDSDRFGYEPSSNFMLLFEDFGEYFYNLNGSSVTTVNSTSDEYFHTNCSLGNSTCGNLNEGN